MVWTTTKKLRRIVRMRIVWMKIVRMMSMMMPMTMIQEMTELKFRLMKRNIPVCNRLSGSVSHDEN